MARKYAYRRIGLFASLIFLMGALVLCFFYPDKWKAWFILAISCFLLFLEVKDLKKYKTKPFIIDKEGIRVSGEFDYKWAEIDHCYPATRGLGRTTRYGIMIVFKKRTQGKIFLDLSKYFLRQKTLLAEALNKEAGRKICLQTSLDIQAEKTIRRRTQLFHIAAWLLIIIASVIIMLFHRFK